MRHTTYLPGAIVGLYRSVGKSFDRPLYIAVRTPTMFRSVYCNKSLHDEVPFLSSEMLANKELPEGTPLVETLAI